MSEFVIACENMDKQNIVNIIDGLMESLREILPWKYDEIIEKLNN